MGQGAAGTLKLALAIAIIDILVLVAYFAIEPALYGTPDWFGDWVGLSALVIGYRTLSLQPLYLYLTLKLFRQRLNGFSRGLVMMLSCLSSLVSLFSIGLLIPVLSGGFDLIEWIPRAFGFLMDFIFDQRQSTLPLALFGVSLLSPLLVYQARRLLVSDVK